jgi:hypothetical protein
MRPIIWWAVDARAASEETAIANSKLHIYKPYYIKVELVGNGDIVLHMAHQTCSILVRFYLGYSRALVHICTS